MAIGSLFRSRYRWTRRMDPTSTGAVGSSRTTGSLGRRCECLSRQPQSSYSSTVQPMEGRIFLRSSQTQARPVYAATPRADMLGKRSGALSDVFHVATHALSLASRYYNAGIPRSAGVTTLAGVTSHTLARPIGLAPNNPWAK